MDGGHIPIQEKDKRSFEALFVIVYRPESIQEVDKHHIISQIVDKMCVNYPSPRRAGLLSSPELSVLSEQHK